MGREGRGPGWILLGLLPLLGLGVLLAFIVLNGAGVGRQDAPPVEDLSVQRVALPTEYEFVLTVRNGGTQPVKLSQVVVNDAIWDFEAEPDSTIPRLGSATVTIPYSWVEGEAYEIVLITNTGTTFDAEVPVAVLTPQFSSETFWRYALIGTYVGVIPVALGLLWYPFLRRLGSAGMNFVLAMTVGLLAFLVIDTLEEAMEVAVELPGVFSGIPLVILLALLTLLGLLGTERLLRGRREEASRLGTSYRIALGIGLHNLGEGLAIGAAFALGEAALGVFLVVGFTLHNITEGVGIAAPILKERPHLAHFLWLALLGGGPAIVGTWIGGFAFSNLLAAVFLAVGAGAILQVIYEVTRLLLKDSARSKTPALSAPNLGGLLAGVAIMYATALLV
jgi:ZIP family zinc transporter